MPNLIDIFHDDAFSAVSLTAAINEMDHVPGRAGELVFVDPNVTQGVATTNVAVERIQTALTLIPTSARGAPAPKEVQDKATLRNFSIPQIKLEDTILADSIVNVREFGTNDPIAGIQSVVNHQLRKMNARHDLTLEYHRLGALKGVIYDADGSVLLDLFLGFDFLNSDGLPEPETVNFDLENPDTQVRLVAQAVQRQMRRAAKTLIPSTAMPHAFCGDNFFDKLIEHPSVRAVWRGTQSAASMLGGGFVFDAFELGGIVFENYRGTDDDGVTVGIAPDEARFFWTGVPGLYAEYFAPADFMETVNTPGLPRYAKLAPPARFNQFVELHTQQNPLPLCLRPQTLMRGIASADSES